MFRSSCTGQPRIYFWQLSVFGWATTCYPRCFDGPKVLKNQVFPSEIKAAEVKLTSRKCTTPLQRKYTSLTLMCYWGTQTCTEARKIPLISPFNDLGSWTKNWLCLCDPFLWEIEETLLVFVWNDMLRRNSWKWKTSEWVVVGFLQTVKHTLRAGNRVIRDHVTWDSVPGVIRTLSLFLIWFLVGSQT